MLTIEERCEAKLAERKIKIPEELLKYQKQDVEDPKKEETEVQESAKIHYDKEDLISFH